MKPLKHPFLAAPLLLGLCAAPLAVSADPLVVKPGYDLFSTDSTGTVFNGEHYQGVPLGSFDFGGSIGSVGVGTTDTIVQRLNGGTFAGSPNLINLQMVTLNLQSATQFDPDGAGPAPTAFYFVTLQSSRSSGEGGPGTLSTGTMQLSFTSSSGGTFTSDIGVFFDLRLGSLTGPIVTSGSFDLAATTSTWTHAAPGGVSLVDGVNFDLAAMGDASEDFWGVPQHTGPHSVVNALVPEPGVWGVWAGLGLIGFGLVRHRPAS